jgi:hypothetical protein
MDKCKECACLECSYKLDCDYEHCTDDCETRKECEINDYGWINPNEE